MWSEQNIVTRSVLVLAIITTLGASALAQDAEPRPGTDATGQALTTGGVLAPSGGAVDTSQGGVGGTGLGKPTGSTDGKGMSVKGPAGQGIQPMQMSK